MSWELRLVKTNKIKKYEWHDKALRKDAIDDKHLAIIMYFVGFELLFMAALAGDRTIVTAVPSVPAVMILCTLAVFSWICFGTFVISARLSKIQDMVNRKR